MTAISRRKKKASPSYRILHFVTVLLFIASCGQVIEADIFHYWHLKKLLKAYAYAKALTGKKLTLVPIPIPIPIPISQNEVIRIPISGGGHSGGGGGGVKTVVLGSGGNKFHGSSGGDFLGGGSYGSSAYGYGYQAYKDSHKLYGGHSSFSSPYNGIDADNYGDHGGLNSIDHDHYGGHTHSGGPDMDYQQSSPFPARVHFGRKRRRKFRFFPGLRRNQANRNTVLVINANGVVEAPEGYVEHHLPADGGFQTEPQMLPSSSMPNRYPKRSSSRLAPSTPPPKTGDLPVGDSWKPPVGSRRV